MGVGSIWQRWKYRFYPGIAWINGYREEKGLNKKPKPGKESVIGNELKFIGNLQFRMLRVKLKQFYPS